jgi:hypothetical protein
MKIKIERETKYSDSDIVTRYWVWVNNILTQGFKSEDEAKKFVDKVKNNHHKIGSETIFEEEI